MRISFQLNGKAVETDAHPGMTVLEFLRSEAFFSVKQGCDKGECGTCSILVDDRCYNACLLLLHSIQGKRVETLEGLNGSSETRKLQESFISEGAIQCGYCTPGMLVSLTALQRSGEPLSAESVRDSLAGNLCRCTGYLKPVKAALEQGS